MLRITVHHDQGTLTFQLEGRLAGRLPQELEECWRNALADRHGLAVRVDLTAVSFIDTAGKECLATLYQQGAELIASGCATRELVAEIARCSRIQRKTR